MLFPKHLAARCERAARTFAQAAVLLLGVVGSVCLTGMFADGAHFLHGVLVNDGFYYGNANRVFVATLTELTVVVPLRLGVTDLAALTLLHSVGLVLIPTVVWAAALWLHRTSNLFWWFVMMYVCAFGVTGFFAVGEANLTYAAVALAAAVIVQDGPISLPQAVAVLLIGLVLLRSFEAVMFLAPILAVGWGLRMRRRSAPLVPGMRGSRVVSVVALVVILVAGVTTAITAYLSLSGGGTFDTAASPARLSRDPRLIISLVVLCGTVLAMSLQRWPVLSRVAGWCAVSVSLLGFALPIMPTVLPSVDGDWPYPWMYYQARIAAGVLVAILIVVVMLLRFSARLVESAQGMTLLGLWVIPLALLVGIGATYVTSCAQFRSWIDDYASVVRTHQGLIPFEESGINPRYAWQWTNPTVSLLLWDRPDQGVVLNRADYTGWAPFDPQTVLPALPTRFLGPA